MLPLTAPFAGLSGNDRSLARASVLGASTYVAIANHFTILSAGPHDGERVLVAARALELASYARERLH